MNFQHPRLTFDEKTHTYLWDGVKKPSVTGVLSSVAVNGKPVCDNRFFGTDTTARDFGNAFHRIAAMMYSGESFTFPDEMKPWYDSLVLFKKNHGFLKPLFYNGAPLVEQPMYHEGLGYCGTPDLICEVTEPCPAIFKRAIVVLDWKTSVQEMDYWRLQTAGYTELFKSTCDFSMIGKHFVTMAVRFGENKYHTVTRTASEVKNDWNYFLSCLNVYKGAI